MDAYKRWLERGLVSHEELRAILHAYPNSEHQTRCLHHAVQRGVRPSEAVFSRVLERLMLARRSDRQPAQLSLDQSERRILNGASLRFDRSDLSRYVLASLLVGPTGWRVPPTPPRL